MRLRTTLTVLAFATACGPAPREAQAPEPVAREEAAPLGIEPRRAEVWARYARLRGEAPGVELASCRVYGGAAHVAAALVDGSAWSVRVPIASGENSFHVLCFDRAGREHRSPTARLRGMLREPALAIERPRIGPDARDAVVYGVVPPLFGSPPLRAVEAALPDLADLGVDVLWLSPIFDNAPRDYGYAVKDYLRVRSDYGTRDDLARLVESAHRHDLRVLLDFVPNHTSIHHPYFAETEELGPSSHYWSFYERDPSGSHQHYFDWKWLPNLDYGNEEVATWMLENGRRWIEDLGVDGYRIDVAWGVQRRSASFLTAFVREMRAADPRALLFAEASARDPFWREHGFDGAYDWTDTPGEWSWKDVFENNEGVADRLDAAVRATPASSLRFLENNDTGPRFITRYGIGMTRVATAALLTLPGIPTLFTGQERGAEYEPYGRSEPLGSEDPHGLRAHVRSLLALRRAVAALRSEEYERLQVAPSDGRVLAFRRGGDPRDAAVVVLRFDPGAARRSVVLPRELAATGRWTDALTGQPVRVTQGKVALSLAPWDVRVLVPAAHAARKSLRD